MAQISLDHVTKRFGATAAVDDLSLTIADGEFFVLLGPTGAGKTTTLRLIAGLEKPGSGRVEIGTQDATQWSVAERDVALVFQYYSLYPSYTVGNLAGNKFASTKLRFMIEENPTAAKNIVTLPIIDRHPVCIQFGNPVRATRVE